MNLVDTADTYATAVMNMVDAAVLNMVDAADTYAAAVMNMVCVGDGVRADSVSL